MTKICRVCEREIAGKPTWFCNAPMHAKCFTPDVRTLLVEDAVADVASSTLVQLMLDVKRGRDTQEAIRFYLKSCVFAGMGWGATWPEDITAWARSKGGGLAPLMDATLRDRMGTH